MQRLVQIAIGVVADRVDDIVIRMKGATSNYNDETFICVKFVIRRLIFNRKNSNYQGLFYDVWSHSSLA